MEKYQILHAEKNPVPFLIHEKLKSHTSGDKWRQSRAMEVETLTIWCSEINGHCEVNLSPETDE